MFLVLPQDSPQVSWKIKDLTAQITLYEGHVVRLQVTRAAQFQALQSYAIEKLPPLLKDYQWDDDTKKLSCGSLQVEIESSKGLPHIRDHAGTTVLQVTDIQTRGLRGLSLSRKLREQEAVYGLGEHGETFNRNPGRYRIWNTDDFNHQPFRRYYCHIPFAVCMSPVSLSQHGFFMDNPGELHFDIASTEKEQLQMSCETGDIDLWIFPSNEIKDILSSYTELTGRTPRPPMWALGYQQCRWSYENEEKIRSITEQLREKRIPCDVIYFDIDYMQDYLVFTWDKEAFSDPHKLIQDLSAEGFSTVCIVDPGVGITDGYHAYEDSKSVTGFFLKHADGGEIIRHVWPGKTHHPDFTNPIVKETWARWQKDHLLDYGVAGIWNDMNEPALIEPPERKEYPADAVHFDKGIYRSHKEVHNIYGLEMVRTSTLGQMEYRPEKRPFTLTRSGWAGIQKYSAVWTGDNRSAFTTMPLDISLNLNMGMSGVPFVGCDIGGFFDNATPELMARWFEWGVFQPFCRSHSAHGSDPHEPWEFGPATEQVLRRLIEWRYRLLPYIYTCFIESEESGMPVNRPLVLEYPFDATVYSIGNQFLLGSDILIAPILQPGCDHRAVYFPPGGWYHLWSNQYIDGGKWALQSAPYGQPAVFFREGSVVPMHPVRQHTKEKEPETTYLDVFPGRRISGKLIEDDGDSFAYQQGEESRILFSGEMDAKVLRLCIGAPQGPYRSARKTWTVRVHGLNEKVTSVECAGNEVKSETQGGLLTFEIPDEKQKLEVTIHLGSG